MKYIEVKIETSHNGVEIVLGKLLSMGITDTVVDDPQDIVDIMEKKEDYEWDYIDDEVTKNLDRNPVIMVYLEDSEENQKLAREINDNLVDLMEDSLYNDALKPLKIVVSDGDDSQWKDKWKEYFKPTKVGEKIVVKPTWEEYEKKEGEVVIEIDPGMAFGTGTHETTSLCLRALEKYVKEGDKVLDVGCGSGILSIGASLLGAKAVLAVDIDETAVEVSSENFKLNGVEDIAKAQLGDLTKGISVVADVVVANLMADLVILLSEHVKKHLKEDGIFISSGILLEKENVVREAVEKAGFKVLEVSRDGQWVAIVAENR